MNFSSQNAVHTILSLGLGLGSNQGVGFRLGITLGSEAESGG